MIQVRMISTNMSLFLISYCLTNYSNSFLTSEWLFQLLGECCSLSHPYVLLLCNFWIFFYLTAIIKSKMYILKRSSVGASYGMENFLCFNFMQLTLVPVKIISKIQNLNLSVTEKVKSSSSKLLPTALIIDLTFDVRLCQVIDILKNWAIHLGWFSFLLGENIGTIQCGGIKYKWSYLLDTVSQTLPQVTNIDEIYALQTLVYQQNKNNWIILHLQMMLNSFIKP